MIMNMVLGSRKKMNKLKIESEFDMCSNGRYNSVGSNNMSFYNGY